MSMTVNLSETSQARPGLDFL